MFQQCKQWAMVILAAGLGVLAGLPAQAQTRLSNRVIQFSEDTIIEFEIRSTQGANRSVVGVMMNPDTSATKIPLFEEVKPYDDFGITSFTDYRGTVAGGTVRPVDSPGANLVASRSNGEGSLIIEYLFRANTPYVFYMDVYTATENRYITTFTSTNVNAVNFRGALDDGNGILMGWEDDGEGRVRPSGAVEVEISDDDFDDVTILAGGVIPCFDETAITVPRSGGTTRF